MENEKYIKAKKKVKDIKDFYIHLSVFSVVMVIIIIINIASYATGRSDYANQVNNVLAFPAIFRGALDAAAKDINMEMKLAAAKAIASIVENEIKADYIIPKPFDIRVLPFVALATAKAAVESGVAPAETDLELIEYRAKNILRR